MKTLSTSTIPHLAGKMKKSTTSIISGPGRKGRSLLSLIGIGAIFALLIAAGFYTSSSASSSPKVPHVSSPSKAAAGKHETRLLSTGLSFVSFKELSFAFLPPQAAPDESIATYSVVAGACTNIPKNTFVLGEAVCAKVSDAPLRAGAPLRRINWTGPKGFVRQTDDVTTDPQETMFTLPANNTSPIDGELVDNRGTWSASLNSTGDNSTRAIAYFNVSDPANIAADLVVYDFSTASDTVLPGDPTGFFLWLSNTGPDVALNVHVTQATPPNMSFVSTTQNSGPTFTCANSNGVTDCSIVSLASGDTATITINYSVSGGAPNGIISSTANISSDTNDPRPDNNSSEAQVEVRSPGGTP
ncbi:MAG: DUF11 domain-containing protein, partial [bacterium]